MPRLKVSPALLVKFGSKNELTLTKPYLYFSSDAGSQPGPPRLEFLCVIHPSIHLSICPLVHLINNYSSSPNYVPRTVLGTGDVSRNQAHGYDSGPDPVGRIATREVACTKFAGRMQGPEEGQTKSLGGEAPWGVSCLAGLWLRPQAPPTASGPRPQPPAPPSRVCPRLALPECPRDPGVSDVGQYVQEQWHPKRNYFAHQACRKQAA